MKIKLLFKTPGVLDQIMDQCVDEDEPGMLHDFFSRWIKDGEVINIEFDIKHNTATVLKR